MHDRLQGGDLTHVDADHSRMNRVEFGEPDWIEDLRAEIADASRANLENHVTALNAKSRRKEAARVTEEGLVDPWRRCQDSLLHEGILTVNKDWFGGTRLPRSATRWACRSMTGWRACEGHMTMMRKTQGWTCDRWHGRTSIRPCAFASLQKAVALRAWRFGVGR